MPPDATASDQEKDVKEVKTKGFYSSFVIYYVSLVFQLNVVMRMFLIVPEFYIGCECLECFYGISFHEF